MGLQEVTWYSGLLRSLFQLFDRLVYSLIRWVLMGIFDIANLSTNTSVFSGIYSRIYVVLGIFMFFKLSFSFFQYIIDPDSMTGKSDKSLSKVFIRVFIMLGALIILPTLLFGSPDGSKKGYLSRIQEAFLPSLPKVIFGVNDIGGLASRNSSFEGTVDVMSEEISVNILRGFFAPSKDIDGVCGDGTYDKIKPIESLEDFYNHMNDTCVKTGTGWFFGLDATQFYLYSYSYLISTIVGVLVVVLLLGITLDLAKRIFKLIILEIIAPVPIMSLIDPKASKDGAFGKWVKSLTTTFLDIFIKMGLVYIIIVLIHLIVNSGTEGGIFQGFPENSGFRGTYLTIMLILGLIFFAKEAPKFIKDALGMKDTGGGLFDDVKSVGKAAGLVGGAALGTASALGGNISAAATAIKEGHGVKGALTALNTPGALLAGALRGGKNGISGANKGNPLKGWGQAATKQSEANANKVDNAAVGSTVFGRSKARMDRFFTGRTAADRMERKISADEVRGSAGESLHSYLEDRAVKKGSGYTVKASGKRADGTAYEFDTTYNDFTKEWLRAKQTGSDVFEVNGVQFDTYGSEAARLEGNLKAQAAELWAIDELSKNPDDRDLTFTDLYAAYTDAGGKINLSRKSTTGKPNSDELKDEFKSRTRKAKNAKNSTKYARYKANARKTGQK